MQWAAYHCQERIGQSTHLLCGRRLLHEWIFDSYSKVEAARLKWLRFNQVAIRAELYSGIQDAVANNALAANIGHRTILPATFIGKVWITDKQLTSHHNICTTS
jgi:hypothetical protein